MWERHRTLARPTQRLAGRGLLSGKTCSVTLCPVGDHQRGISVQWGPDGAAHPVEACRAAAEPLHSTLWSPAGNRLALAEHLFGALGLTGLSSVKLVVEGGEVPYFDSSAKVFVEAIHDAGLVEMDGTFPKLRQPNAKTTLPDGRAYQWSLCEEGDVPGWAYYLDFSNPRWFDRYMGWRALPSQTLLMPWHDDAWMAVAQSRTFGLAWQAQTLRMAHYASLGLIRVRPIEDALYYRRNGTTVGPERMEKEAAHHKLLDLVGDTVMRLGFLPRCHLSVWYGGHRLHGTIATHLKAALPLMRVVGGAGAGLSRAA